MKEVMKRLIKKCIPHKTNLFLFRIKKRIKKKFEERSKKVECPICKSKYEIFDSFGLKPRINARCYKCFSLERHRLLWKYLQERTQIFKLDVSKRILHFAPEHFFYEIFSHNKSIEYLPCDLYPENYGFEGNTKVEKVDITNIPFEENYFDFILCNHVLEHVPDDVLAISELYRVMKKGGAGIFQVPINYNREFTYEDFSITTPEEREKAFGQYDHVRLYGCDYKNRLEKAGFKVMEDDYVKSFSKKELFKYGLMPSELIYYCEKK